MSEEGFSRAESAAAVGDSQLNNVASDAGPEISEGADVVKPTNKKQCLYSGAKCCCGGNLRTICIIIGVIEVVLLVVDGYFCFTTVPIGNTIDYEVTINKIKEAKHADFPLGYGVLVVWGFYILCLLAAAVLLVVGAWFRKKLFVLLHSILLAVAFVLMLVFLAMFVVSYGAAIQQMTTEGTSLAKVLWVMPAIACAFWGLKALIFYIYFAIVAGGLYTHFRAGQMFDGKFLNYGAQKYNYNAAPLAPAPTQAEGIPPDYQQQQQQPQEPPPQQYASQSQQQVEKQE